MTSKRTVSGWLAAAGVSALIGAGGVALAQGGPESLLPPGFDRPTRAARPTPSAAPTRSVAQPHLDVLPDVPAPVAAPVPVASRAPLGPIVLPAGITSFDQLAALPPERLDPLLGLTPKYDIPPSAQRGLSRVGVIDPGEGGLMPLSLAGQSPALVRAALAGNSGRLVSRWGHILLRRALASRLDAPAGMAPTEFAALRTALLLRMGEGEAARAMVQDVDPARYDAALTLVARDAYIATADFTGFCPVQQALGGGASDGPGQVLRALCQTYGGATTSGLDDLDRLGRAKVMAPIDMQLAQKYAGANGGGARRAISIDWKGVSDMTPWRYGLALAVGLTPPEEIMKEAGAAYDYVAALAPMAPLGLRAQASDRAGAAGVLSSAAMVDLYGQIYSNDDVTGDAADRALILRDAYVGAAPADRLAAMRQLWDGTVGAEQRYGRMVLTAYAAARLAPEAALADDAGDVLAAMLSAGLDGNAARWRATVKPGSDGWAQLALGLSGGVVVDTDMISKFREGDKSEGQIRTKLLIAGLSGLGRINDSARASALGKVNASVDGHSRWIDTIDAAAQAGNPALVALLAGLGMQGDGWDKMTPRYLFHIVSALNRVGMNAEARMIAAEAVARA